MIRIDAETQIGQALQQFEKKPLADSAGALLELLGYRSARTLALVPNTGAQFATTFGAGETFHTQARTDEWKSVDVLFQFTDSELTEGLSQQAELDLGGQATPRWDSGRFNSYLFLCIELSRAHYARGLLSGITRAVNKLFTMPVIVLYRHGDSLTLSVIHRRANKLDAGKDVLEKVTSIKDIRFAAPHRAHVAILRELSLAVLHERHGFDSFDALHKAWQKTLDTSELNASFYRKLANWYFWALDNVSFPKDAPKDPEGRDSISLIRLITRIIFCWFLKEKGLISEKLFREDELRKLLVSLDGEESSYYTAILQNLFFATLNTEMDVAGAPPSRRFIKEGRESQDSDDHMIHQVWRHEKRIQDLQEFERLMRAIPFLNGGLFECLDERVEKPNSSQMQEIRVDGFSVKPAKQPKVPNKLFFGAAHREDLSQAYGEARYRQTEVIPLIPLLDSYKFTVAENTPLEEEVALDPELLGHVFENLLAAYNPETGTTARKATGAFYTPRVVVDFMIDQSLLAHLGTALGKAFPACPDRDDRLRQLLDYTSEAQPFDAAESKVLLDAIDQIKAIDPACGSGAFLMGALHKLVFLLGKLDPGNIAWHERQIAKARQIDSGTEGAIQAVNDAFARDHHDYARKLYLIENCLYGVDIQPIAVQIAKLRCFISLVVEQEKDVARSNLGILPLPNLETKFIAANTLLGLGRRGQQDLTASEEIEQRQKELRDVRHQHFLARKWKDKKVLRKRDKQLRAALAAFLKSSHTMPGPLAEMVADWDPYRPDQAAPFFDPTWMFGISTTGQDGPFHVVLGNPPYVRQESLKNIVAFEGRKGLECPFKNALKDEYFCYTGTADLYVYFFEQGFKLLAPGGVLCYISSNKYFRAGYGERLRHYLAVNSRIRLAIDFGDAPVFTAIAYPSILLVQKAKPLPDRAIQEARFSKPPSWDALVPKEAVVQSLTWAEGPPIEEFPALFAANANRLEQLELKPDGWRLESAEVLRLLEKLRAAGTPLGEYVEGRFYRGVLTGLNEAFVVDRATRDRLIREHKSSAKVLKPFLRGRDVKRWCVEFSDQYLIKIESSENKTHPWSDKSPTQAEKVFASEYPAIHAWFRPFRQALIARSDQGRYFWELRSCAYWAEFEQPKVLVPAITEGKNAAVDEKGMYSNNKATIFVCGHASAICAVINSSAAHWFAQKVFMDKQGGFFDFEPRYSSQWPIPNTTTEQKKLLERFVEQILSTKRQDANADVSALEREIDALVYGLYGLTAAEIAVVEEGAGR